MAPLTPVSQASLALLIARTEIPSVSRDLTRVYRTFLDASRQLEPIRTISVSRPCSIGFRPEVSGATAWWAATAGAVVVNKERPVPGDEGAVARTGRFY